MPGHLTLPLFTLLGALITGHVGYYTARRRIAGEIRKVQHGVLQVYADTLGAARLAAYPHLYSLLSEAIKHIDYPELSESPPDLSKLEHEINKWDSVHGLLFSKESGDKAMALRSILRDLIREKVADALEESKSRSDLEDAIVGLEIALRKDLGVYALEGSDIDPMIYKGRMKMSVRNAEKESRDE